VCFPEELEEERANCVAESHPEISGLDAVLFLRITLYLFYPSLEEVYQNVVELICKLPGFAINLRSYFTLQVLMVVFSM
jgi:hypothetical protein